MNRNLLLKLGVVLLLVILLFIPLLLIDGVVDERQGLRNEVLLDIARSSSHSQRLTGPLLVVPYRKTVREWRTHEKTGNRYLEERERGLSPEAASAQAGARTGKAFVTSALTTVGGFAVLMQA